jgi:hypothetical protein
MAAIRQMSCSESQRMWDWSSKSDGSLVAIRL